MLLIRLDKIDLVTNKFVFDKLNNICSEYDCDGIDKIIKRIYYIKQQLEFNCNFITLCDNLLLYILEVKFLCKK